MQMSFTLLISYGNAIATKASGVSTTPREELGEITAGPFMYPKHHNCPDLDKNFRTSRDRRQCRSWRRLHEPSCACCRFGMASFLCFFAPLVARCNRHCERRRSWLSLETARYSYRAAGCPARSDAVSEYRRWLHVCNILCHFSTLNWQGSDVVHLDVFSKIFDLTAFPSQGQR